MATSGQGFVIPARVVVTVEGLAEVRRQLQKFASDAKTAAATGQPLRTQRGTTATVEDVRKSTGQAINDTRQAAALARSELARTDLSKKRRQEIQAELQALKLVERQLQRNTAAARTEGGKVKPPIYPTGELRFPSIAAQERGSQPRLMNQPRPLPKLPERPPEPEAPAPRKRTSRVKTTQLDPNDPALREARVKAEQAAQDKVNAAARLEVGRRDSAQRAAARKAAEESAAATAAARRSKVDPAVRAHIDRAAENRAKVAAYREREAAEQARRAEHDAAKAESTRRVEAAIKPPDKRFIRTPEEPKAAAPPPPPPPPPKTPPKSATPPPEEPPKKRPRLIGGLIEEKASAKTSTGGSKAAKDLESLQQLLTAEGRKTLEGQQALTRTRQQVKAVEDQMRAADTQYLKATADSANARRDEANRIKILQAGKDPGDLSGVALKARAAQIEREQADRAKAEATKRATRSEIDASARLLVSNRVYDQQVKKRQAELIKEGIKTGEIPRGNAFQRLQSALQPASGRLPEENLKALQFVGDKLQRSLGYAASGLLIGVGATAIAELYRDATQLEVTFVRLKGQLEGIGQVDAFSRIRDGVRNVAAETGQASTDVAAVFSRLVGLSQDPAKAMKDTASAMKLMTVTGLDVKSVLSSIVPIAKAFGVSAEDIGDSVVEMGEKFGIAEDDLLQFLGKTAVVAKQAGLSLDELTIIGGTMANSLGKPIEASSESINKVTGQLELNMQKIFQILQANPGTEPAISKMIDQFAAGKPAQALIELLKVVDQFSPDQRNQILTNVVSRREAEDFNAMITNSSSILQQLQDKQNGLNDNSGRLDRRFKDLKETVIVAFQSINAAFESLGELLLRSGIGDVLKDIASMLGVMVGALGLAVTAFNGLNEAISVFGANNLLSGFTRIIAVIGLFALAQDKLTKANEMGVVAANAESTAEAANAGSKEVNAVATEEAALAQTNLNRARTAEAGAAGVGTAGVAAGDLAWSQSGRAVGVQEFNRGMVSREVELASLSLAGGVGTRTARLGTRINRSLPRFGQSYASQFGAYQTAIAGAEVAPSATLFQRAAAGGRFLKVPAANALQEASGAATGVLASPLLTAGIVLVAALYAKNQYEEIKKTADAASEDLLVNLRNATDENVRMVAGMNDDLGELFIARITGDKTIGELGRSEQSYLDTRDLTRKMGGTPRAEVQKPLVQNTASYIKETDQSINEKFAAQYTDKFKEELVKTVTQNAALTDIGVEAGVFEDQGFLKSLFFDVGGGPPRRDSKVLRPEAGTAQFARLKQGIRDYTGPEGEAREQALRQIDEFENNLGNAPELTNLQSMLTQTKDASGTIAAFGGNVESAYGAINQWGDTKFKSLNELASMLESGEIGEAEYVQQVQEATRHLTEVGSKLKGTEAAESRIATRDALKKADDVRKSAAVKLNGIAAALAATTSQTPKSSARDLNQQVLAILPLRDRLEALPQMLQEDMAVQEEILQAIPNPEERLAALNRGLQLSPMTKTTYLTAATRYSLPATNALKDLGARENKDAETLGEEISSIAVYLNVSMQDAALLYIDRLIAQYEEAAIVMIGMGDWVTSGKMTAKVAQLKGIRESFSGAFAGVALPNTEPSDERKQLNAIESEAKTDEARTARALGQSTGNTLAQASIKAGAAKRALERTRRARAVKDTKTTDEDVEAAEGAAAEAVISESDAWFNYAQLQRQRQVILANRDPVLETAARMAVAVAARNRALANGRLDERENAEQEILKLQQEEAENQLNIVRGTLAVQSARDAEDPLRSAMDALRAAELELANAHGEADRQNKEAQVIQAQQALRNAVSAGISADAELAISLAEMRDDPVTAANLGLQEALRKLQEAQAKNITDRSVLAPIEQQIAAATKAAFLAPINKQIEDLDFLYGMEQISLSQYVSGLEAQLSRLQINSKEYRDLALKIFNLKKQGEQDLQFNLPTTLGLPTLYEARRVTQSSQLGIGYQDNRNVSMIVNVNGAQDPMTITAQIVGALSAASGITSTPLMGMGI